MSVPMMAFAAPTDTTLGVNKVAGHTYTYSQLFVGDLAEDGKTLSNVKWGSDVATSITYKAKASADATEYTVDTTITPKAGDPVPTAVLDYLASLQSKTTNDPAQATADIISPWVKGNGTAFPETGAATVKTGYYVVKDAYTNPDDKQTTTLSTTLIEVVGPTTMNPKAGTTTDEKTITTDTLGKDETKVDGKKDNVSVGDTVNYQIEAKIPENAGSYNYFYFIITDKLDAGLTFTNDSIKVYKNEVKEENRLTEATETANNDYIVHYGPTDTTNTFEVGMVDAKHHAGETIIVTYSAVLNENAEIGDTANKNTSTVKYSNDPNHQYGGNPENPTPGFPDETSHDPLGETPKSETETYTTGIKITKVDDEGETLTGAEFTITGDSVQTVLVTKEEFKPHEGEGTGQYYKLNNGTYTKEAPISEDQMISAPAGSKDGYVVAENDFEGETVVYSGVKYRVVNEGETPTHILQKSNIDKYDTPTTTYDKEIKFEQKDTTAEGVTATAEVDEDGLVTFKGLGAGNYTISETKTPDGYNTMADLNVNITFTADPSEGAYHWTTTTDSNEFKYNHSTGLFEITIENNKGQELPSTGGIGTTIFYVLGAILVIGAGVLLVTRRRMNAN